MIMPGERGPVAVPSSSMVLDARRSRRIHVVGIGGAGMSAIASVLAAMGHAVTGSDLKRSPATARLAAAGVAVSVGHDAATPAAASRAVAGERLRSLPVTA